MIGTVLAIEASGILPLSASPPPGSASALSRDIQPICGVPGDTFEKPTTLIASAVSLKSRLWPCPVPETAVAVSVTGLDVRCRDNASVVTRVASTSKTGSQWIEDNAILGFAQGVKPEVRH